MEFSKEEFAKDVVKAFIEDYNAKKNEYYDFNEEKCDKMNDIIAYCQELEKTHDCKIIRCMIEPKYEQGFIQVLFSGELVLDKTGLAELTKTLGLCDGVNITTNPVDDDLFQITFFVENLWVRRRSRQ